MKSRLRLSQDCHIVIESYSYYIAWNMEEVDSVLHRGGGGVTQYSTWGGGGVTRMVS